LKNLNLTEMDEKAREELRTKIMDESYALAQK